MKKILIIDFLLIAFFSFFLGCTSDSGGSGGNKTGTIALYIADGPTDDYENIWVWIKKISLIPANNEKHVTIFEDISTEGYKIDLLTLQEQDLLLTLNKSVPVGTYEKIRLEINDIEPEGGTGPCTDLEVKLPSGKIDLLPKEKIQVGSDGVLSIRLDIDADKSLDLKVAGQSGQCIFQPVVFVSVESGFNADNCPEMFTGTISQLNYSSDNTIVDGFLLELNDDRGQLSVVLNESVLIVSQNGQLSDQTALDEDQTVIIRGLLSNNSHVDASLVVLGGLEQFDGEISDITGDSFTLMLDDSSGDLVVTMSENMVLIDTCDKPLDEMVLADGVSAKVYGKFISNGITNTFVAILIMVEDASEQTILSAMEPFQGGYDLTLTDSDSEIISAFLPEDAKISLDGSIAIDAAQLAVWIDCVPRNVDIIFDLTSTQTPTVSELIVIADKWETTILSIDTAERILYTADGVIAIESNAVLLKLDDEDQITIDLDDINIDDTLTVFGVEACKNDIDFHGFIVIVTSALEDGQSNLPDKITDNGVLINLSATTYDQDLEILGNNIRINGVAGSSCTSEDGTVITGTVTIRGNNISLKGINFTGIINETGNNISYVNCCN